MALIPLLAWTLAGTVLAADVARPAERAAASSELRVTESNGLALGAGVGVQYVALGIQASYYFQLPHTLYRVVPYAAAGVGLCGSTDGIGECALAAGVMGSWGHKHRVFVDLGYGPVAEYRYSFHGEKAASRAISGPFASLGYEYMSFAGVSVRSELGASYVLGPPLLGPQDRAILVLTLVGIGYKFW